MIKQTLYILTAFALATLAVDNAPFLEGPKLFNLEFIAKTQAKQSSASSSLKSPNHSDSMIAQTDTISDEVWDLLAQAREAKANKNLDQAASIYQDILSKPLPTQTRVMTYIKLGDILQIKMDYPDALAAYQAANQLNPTVIKPWVGQVRAHYHLGDLNAAKRQLAEAKQYLPKQITTLEELSYYSSLSAASRELGEFNDSISLIGTALRLNPYITNAASCKFTREGLKHLNIDIGVLTQKYRSARCSLGALPPDSAIQTWGDVTKTIYAAVDQQGIYTDSYPKTGLKRLVSILPNSLFQPDTPKDRFNEATAISALNLGTGLINRAITMGDSNSMEAAITFLRTSVKHDSSYAWNHIYLSSALLAQGRPDEAIASAKLVLALPNTEGKEPGKTWVWAHNNLGYAFELQGKTEEAIREYEKAIALDPTFTTAQENLKLISAAQSP